MTIIDVIYNKLDRAFRDFDKAFYFETGEFTDGHAVFSCMICLFDTFKNESAIKQTKKCIEALNLPGLCQDWVIVRESEECDNETIKGIEVYLPFKNDFRMTLEQLDDAIRPYNMLFSKKMKVKTAKLFLDKAKEHYIGIVNWLNSDFEIDGLPTITIEDFFLKEEFEGLFNANEVFFKFKDNNLYESGNEEDLWNMEERGRSIMQEYTLNNIITEDNLQWVYDNVCDLTYVAV